jgi:hypothetical protein
VTCNAAKIRAFGVVNAARAACSDQPLAADGQFSIAGPHGAVLASHAAVLAPH